MLLTKIKLSGFKSFVDPTIIPFKSSLTGVVGPNGCGKSNVIDAVRCVMGESAAKQLRGDSITDVIFNGAASRQPVNQAGIELIFDNSDGTVGGEYAKYTELSIKREINRDGQSCYYLNNTKCRRKDISGVFAGTGLGPRSYSIIQQGTISRLIEAKPEELRVFLEEAAGISKYKERRRETSNRIRHTRENLERLQDIRMELEKQLAHLKRQASAAERYKIYKDEQRQLKGELHALKWQEIDGKIAGVQERLAKEETQLEAKIAELRTIEADIEQSRDDHVTASESFNEVQSQFYRVGGEIGKLEQSVKHQRERKQQLHFDFEHANQHWEELRKAIEHDQTELAALDQTLATLMPQVEQLDGQASTAKSDLDESEAAMKAWQARSHEHHQQAASAQKTAEVEQTRLQHLEGQEKASADQLNRTQQALASIQLAELEEATQQQYLAIEKDESVVQAIMQRASGINDQLLGAKDKVATQQAVLDEQKANVQRLAGKQASLEALQEAMLASDEKAKSWLEQQGLGKSKRLMQTLKVSSGWETAVETVLGGYLQAVCVDSAMSDLANKVAQYDGGTLNFMLTVGAEAAAEDSLAGKIAGGNFPAMLSSVLVASDLNQALAMQAGLQPHQSVITQEGLWFGPDWFRVPGSEDSQTGVLAREQALREVSEEVAVANEQLATLEQQLESLNADLNKLEEQKEAISEELAAAKDSLSQRNAEYRVKKASLEQQSLRRTQLEEELETATQAIKQYQEDITKTREQWQEAMAAMSTFADKQAMLASEKTACEERLVASREHHHQQRDEAHGLQVQLQTSKTKAQSLQQNIERLESQFQSQGQRKEELEQAMSESEDPIEALEEKRQQLLEERVGIEKEMLQTRQVVEAADQTLRQREKDRHQVDDVIQTNRQGLEKYKLEIEGLRVRKQTFEEQLDEMSLVAKEILENIDADKTSAMLEEQLEHLERKINRLGPINLAAIDEYQEKEERKTYLDAQHEDLDKALQTLENAIAKIDRETRQKFKDTYDTVNNSFKELFPKIFGGGSAYLELTGNDLLDTGVTVIAQPPGKRNSTIHLLSGGEKALTAIALVFSIFQLNPAPFCMLDEVDAPLDDNNVMRMCNLIREMSAKVQFIIITHNKVTMEMTNQLMGVTMHEPGVSRIVSVDVDAAVELAEA